MSANTQTQMVKTAAAPQAAAPARASFGTRALDLLSSVRFGVVLLVVLVLACVAGMLVMQVNMDGFDKYYAALTPSQQLLYGALGLFDIYHSWYFNALVLALSLNIILSSIDHFPGAWKFITRPKLDASAHWLRGQPHHAELTAEGADAGEVAGRVRDAWRAQKLRARVTEKGGAAFVFAQRGAWNRLGSYAVHVALLVIFAGGFMTARFGHTGQMSLSPGESGDSMTEMVFNDLDRPQPLEINLPFRVECTDVQQKLIERDGALTPMNTLDWITRVRIDDPERGTVEGTVQLNRPFDYRGYRFFQSSFTPEGKARQVRLVATPEAGGEAEELVVMRDGAATLKDGTRVELTDFYPDFALQNGRALTQSPDYLNPAAGLRVVRPGVAVEKTYAFGEGRAQDAPSAGRSAGYRFKMLDFERVGDAHVLSVQKDPGATVVYVGFIMLTLTLVLVFLFSHQRVWARVEPRGAGQFSVIVGGDTNRNQLAFGDRFQRLVNALGSRQ